MREALTSYEFCEPTVERICEELAKSGEECTKEEAVSALEKLRKSI